jgi:hypothetical protein
VREGEEARLVPGSSYDAEIRSRGALPLRVRREALHHARPAFPGTAVVLGERTFEVLSEDADGEDGGSCYRLRAWPDGEVYRDRVVYGPAFVRNVEAERQSARLRAAVRPWRFLLYPLVGMLPEEPQQRVCDRLGLYSVTATLVSGLAESASVLSLLALAGRVADEGRAIALLLAAPLLVVFVLPGLGRAFSALFLRETGGSPFVELALHLFRAAATRPRRRAGPAAHLTRAEFWRRLSLPDEQLPCGDGSVLMKGALPHLGWDASRALELGDDHWRIEPQPPQLEGTRLVYPYRLVPLAEEPLPGAPERTLPSPLAYADEVLGSVRCEWDAFNSAFAWLTSLLDRDVQARAFHHRGGPAAVRRATLGTAAGGAAIGLYLLGFLPGPPGDPLAPVAALAGLLLLLDAGLRVRSARAGRYAPSLFRWLLPSHVLRPERLAYHAHRDAEKDAMARAG